MTRGVSYNKCQDMNTALYPVVEGKIAYTDVLIVSAKNIQNADLNHQPATSVLCGHSCPAPDIRYASAAASKAWLVVLTRRQIKA